MRRRKILHVIPTLDRSGAEKQLMLLATRLPADRYDVTVCALTREGPYAEALRDAGLTVHCLHKRFSWDPLTLWRLFRLVKSIAPDIVHTWLFAGNCYGRVAAWAAGVPHLIASERCVDSWKAGYQLAIDRWLARFTDRVVANTKAVSAFYEKAGIPRSQLVVIPNGIEAESNGTPAPERSEVLDDLGVPSEKVTIGFIGRLWPQKRVRDLIWAVDVLRISGRDTPLFIVGDGPRRGALERFSRNLELQQQVHFLGHRDDAQRLLHGIDILVIPSRFEGMPNVALEAMLIGKPVVATRIAGVDELIVHDQTGLLVEPLRPFELAKAINRLLDEPELRERLGAEGKDRVERLFSVDRMVQAYEQLYEELN
ncbi:Putative glycosyltransferase EpsF [Planctomycetes bacterium Pan216]|uniref:Glycosyltransferase EpsF n=1 Tax=Kolteria novifilia TaxID=2527975 RepID=A0A518B306_9BACT|nr:Putative glycosyltransferase EpsF [Planctomycetes bacterium Pan216]